MHLPTTSQNFFMRNATYIAVSALTLVMAGAIFLFSSQASQNDEAQGWLIHSYEVRGHIRQIDASLQRATISYLDFMHSGIEHDLDGFREAWRRLPSVGIENPDSDMMRSIDQEFEVIRHMTADNPRQQNNLDLLEKEVADARSFFETQIEARKTPTFAGIEPGILTRGQELNRRVNETISRMRDEENHLITLRREKEALTTAESRRLTLGVTVSLYALLTFLILFYQHRRKRIELQLQLYAQQLERSEEELKMQQEELRASNEEIEASNEELEEKGRTLEEKNTQLRMASAEIERGQRTIEEKIREVEQASRYKSEFLANISHELRTPLNSLLILSKLLADNSEKNLTPEQVEDARIIHNGGIEVLNLINDILDLSKIEAGKISVILDDAGIADMAERIQQQFNPVAKQRGLEFPVEVAPDLPATMRTDIKRVEQIIKNLLSNAFKFTEKGFVKLSIRRADAMAEQSFSGMDIANSVIFSVADTGVGIDNTKFKDIFEAFQQEDGSVDRHFGGTGLGFPG